MSIIKKINHVTFKNFHKYNETELWGILDDFDQAWKFGYWDVLLETNCLETLHHIKENSTRHQPESHIVNAIQDLLSCDWDTNLKHVHRECNRLVDYLTNAAECNRHWRSLLVTTPWFYFECTVWRSWRFIYN